MSRPKHGHSSNHFDGPHSQSHAFGDYDANLSKNLDADNYNANNTENILKQRATIPVFLNKSRSNNDELDSSRIMVPSEKELKQCR